MSGISPVSGIAGGLPAMPAQQTGSIQAAPQPSSGLSTASVGASQSAMSFSSTSISATSESLLYASSPILADEKAVGLAVLLLTLAYLQSDDDEEKKDLLSLMLALTQMQRGGRSEMMMYSASSLSMESTQFTAVSSDTVASTYSGSGGAVQGAPAADAGLGQLDVVA